MDRCRITSLESQQTLQAALIIFLFFVSFFALWRQKLEITNIFVGAFLSDYGNYVSK